MFSGYKHTNEWNHLISKAIRKPYLGTIKSRWRVVSTKSESIRITLYTEKFKRSLACSLFLFTLLLILLYTKQLLHGKYLLIFGLPFIWLFLGLGFGYRRELIWLRKSDKIIFVFGFYSFLKEISVNRSYLSGKLQWSSRPKRKRKTPIIYLYNKQSDSCLKLIAASRRLWIVPVFGALSEILEGRCIDETKG